MLGHGFKKMEDDGVHTVIAKSSIEFIHELCAGDLFVIETGFIKCGTKSCTHLQRLTNADTGILHAVQETVEVFFDGETRKSVPIPGPVRPLIEGCMVSPEEARMGSSA